MHTDNHAIAPSPLNQALGQSHLAWLVFLFGIVLTSLVWHTVSAWEEEKARHEFVVQTKDTLEAVQQRLEAYINVLYGARGLFAASDEVTRDEWRRYTAMVALGGHYPGVHNFAFIRHVLPQDKAGFEKRVRNDTSSASGTGYPGFAITPAGVRNDYFPIEYIEPDAGNRNLLGVDRGAEPDVRRTLERARDSALPVVSGRLHGPGESLESSHFFLIVLPVYRNGANPGTVPERRAMLEGFVSARVELETLLKGVVGSGVLEELFFELYDGGSAAEKSLPMSRATLLYSADNDSALHAGAVPATMRFTRPAVVELFGRNWLFFFGSRPEYAAAGSYLPAVVLLGGVVSSALVFALVLMLVTQRRRVMEEIVRQKSLFSQVVDALPVNVFLKDMNFRYVLVNEEATQLLNMPKDAVIGRNDFELFPYATATALREHDEQARAEGQLVMREERMVVKEQPRCLLAGKEIIYLPGNSEPMLIGFSIDITERLRLEQEATRGRANELSRSLADAVGIGLIGVDAAHRVIFANPKAQEILGIEEKEMQGKFLDDVVLAMTADGSTLSDGACPAWEVIAAGRSFQTDDWSFRRGDGSRFPAGVVIAPTYDRREVSGAVLSFQDITQRKQAEETIRDSENRYRSLFDNMQDGFAYCRMFFENGQPEDYVNLSVNAAFERLTGLKDAVGKKVTEVIPGLRESNPELFEIYGRVALSGKPERFETYVEALNKWFSISVYSQKREYFVVIFDDISWRKQAEIALKETEQRQAAILDNIPDLAWLKDSESRFIAVNEPCAQACGMSAAEVVGKSDFDFWPAEIAELYRRDDREVMDNRERKRVEEPLTTKDGNTIWIETIKTPIFDGQGRVVGTVGTARDVTARRAAEEALIHHMAELARLNAELDEFTYVASHDLQEPVRKLVAFSDLLRKDVGGDLPPRAEQDLVFIIDAALRMRRLVEDLLTLSRTSKVSMVRGEIALDDAVNAALEALELRIAESGATIHRMPLPSVSGDMTLLTQLYQNLIGNALKFVTDKRPEISLTAEQFDGEWVFGVRDNGIGISPQYVDQIFQPFKRLHGRGQFEGSGVGLSICRKVVERHRGRIWVESEEDKGAHFKFILGNTGL